MAQWPTSDIGVCFPQGICIKSGLPSLLLLLSRTTPTALGALAPGLVPHLKTPMLKRWGEGPQVPTLGLSLPTMHRPGLNVSRLPPPHCQPVGSRGPSIYSEHWPRIGAWPQKAIPIQGCTQHDPATMSAVAEALLNLNLVGSRAATILLPSQGQDAKREELGGDAAQVASGAPLLSGKSLPTKGTSFAFCFLD